MSRNWHGADFIGWWDSHGPGKTIPCHSGHTQPRYKGHYEPEKEQNFHKYKIKLNFQEAYTISFGHKKSKKKMS